MGARFLRLLQFVLTSFLLFSEAGAQQVRRAPMRSFSTNSTMPQALLPQAPWWRAWRHGSIRVTKVVVNVEIVHDTATTTMDIHLKNQSPKTKVNTSKFSNNQASR